MYVYILFNYVQSWIFGSFDISYSRLPFALLEWFIQFNVYLVSILMALFFAEI